MVKVGDRVTVRNSTLSGHEFIEGTAVVRRLIGKPIDGKQRAAGHFDEDDESPDYVVERWVEVPE